MSAARLACIHLAGLVLQLLRWSLRESEPEARRGRASTALQNPTWSAEGSALTTPGYDVPFGPVLQQRGKKPPCDSIPEAKIRNCKHGRQRDGLGWEPRIFYECFQSPKAVFPSLLTALNSLAQSAPLLLCAHSFTQCSWAYLSKIITQPPSEIVAQNGLFHRNRDVSFPRLKAEAGTTTPCIPWT